MKWTKLGRIITPQKDLPWMRTHAMLPTPFIANDSSVRVYVSGRDDRNRSHIGYAVIDPEKGGRVLEYGSEAVLSPGELGCFDDNGVTPTYLLRKKDGQVRMYYIGWKPRSTTRMSLMPGLAISDDDGKTFRRYSRAPILRLTDREPISILTSPCVLNDGDGFKMWYVSGVDWIHPDLPRYNIKFAESPDGIEWTQTSRVCIDHASERETSLARPWVVKENGIYKMWFSSKRPPQGYRLGYAESDDGVNWRRKDDQVGITVSNDGWDSEMIEYAAVFSARGKTYMLYNGNGYGLEGAGLAVLEKN